ncbi:GNAT family N-acetyltransferase [Cellulomonas humilata]|uniref:GNAT family N-acetyltransferase n=1 Tax=Cellulomonas humilata TaxID=144055 RepID=A0A7Y5ZYA6_9CELL|nr:GNAT family N-acetyltransferase [Cellulomonas humilata]
MTVEVLPAVGRYDSFYEVVGVKKPGGSGCWCMAYRDSRVPNEERAQYMRDECAQEPGPGVLAYVDGEAAGWCSVAPRSSYRRLMRSRTIPFVDDRDAWSIVCFVVRPAFRRRGLMHELLEGAVAHARSCGAEVVEGYPIAVEGGDRVDLISGYVGTRRLFEAAGFSQAGETTGHSGGRPRVIMRRELRGLG